MKNDKSGYANKRLLPLWSNKYFDDCDEGSIKLFYGDDSPCSVTIKRNINGAYYIYFPSDDRFYKIVKDIREVNNTVKHIKKLYHLRRFR